LAEPGQNPVQAAVSAADTRISGPGGFEEFFRASYRELVATAMIAGASQEEAEDAAAKTLAEMIPIWPVPERPLAYARRAVVHNFIKDKTRGTRRIARRLIERGHIQAREGAPDTRLTAWEDDQWVADVLSCLPPAQREVMECIARGLHRDEIPSVLGKSNEAVRRNLCDARARLADQLHPDGEHKQPRRKATRSARQEAR
jgi:RNA polymerase sigma factor (sigma-70 family)